MSDHVPISSLWEQYYQQSILMDDHLLMPCPEFSDATTVPTTTNTNFDIDQTLFTPNYSVVLSCDSPENSTSSAGTDLKPKTSPGTPKRRRSRASKLTPTTFLNAHITNFRALVQKHTGCSHTEKGPITLCFGSSSIADHQQINGTLIPKTNNSMEVVSDRSFRDQQAQYQAQVQQYYYDQQHQQGSS
ncbi:VQ motif-containing protein motif-containing protein 22-like [Forsythia ovata]|uniref:VQ motif-containing protein motif-containing protein 22-like n=1 Tax=Forsythia ovata TaxID=205694 RepID=A0ABD1QCP7_9LAMI